MIYLLTQPAAFSMHGRIRKVAFFENVLFNNLILKGLFSLKLVPRV